jgi:uncharacterized protein (DUF58 family)
MQISQLSRRSSRSGTTGPIEPVTARGTSATRKIGLSVRGRTFIAVGLISLVTGLVLGVVDLQRVGVLLLVLPIPAWLAVREARSHLRIGHAVTPPRIQVGERAEVRLILANPHAFGTGPLRITETVPGGRTVRFSVAGVRGRQRRAVAYPIPTLPRGRYTVGPTAVVASDPFGLVTADTRSSDTAELIVQPTYSHLAPLTLPIAWRDGAASLSHSVGVGGSDDASVREYRHGDDLRKIHWRSTARTGAFMVRQEERPWHGESLVLLDTRAHAFPGATTAEHGSDALEWAVSAAASIGCHIAERGRRVSLATSDGRLAQDESNGILDLLADVKPALRADLAPLLTSLNGLGRETSVFAILAAYDQAALTEVAAHPRLPGSAVAVLMRPWTWMTADRDLAREEVWHAAADALRVAGWRVVGADVGDDIAELWPTLLSMRPGVMANQVYLNAEVALSQATVPMMPS